MQHDAGLETPRDRWLWVVFVALLTVLSPLQAFLIARIVEAPVLHTVWTALIPRAGQLALLVLMVAIVKRNLYAMHRTPVLIASFGLLWAFHIESNSRLLLLSMGRPLAIEFIALSIVLSLSMHAALPIVPGRLKPDLVAYLLAVGTQMVHAPLPWAEAVRFGTVLAALLAVPVMLRVAIWRSGELMWQAQANLSSSRSIESPAVALSRWVEVAQGIAVDFNDDAYRDAARGLTHVFCSVQIALSACFIFVWPETLPILGSSAIILMLNMLAQEAVWLWYKSDRQLLGWAWCVILTLGWLPSNLASRWGVFDVAVPPVCMVLGAAMWAHYSFYQNLLGIPLRQRMVTDACVSINFSLHRSWSSLEQPAETVLVVCALIVGELLGFAWISHHQLSKVVLDQHSQLAQEALEQRALRVLNHTAKRVMSNTAHACQLVLEKLKELDDDEAGQRVCARVEVERLLRSCRAGAVSGYHACKAQLLEGRLTTAQGAHRATPPSRASDLDCFTVSTLLANIGCYSDPRFDTAPLPSVALSVKCYSDRNLIESILFNAAQNARVHGAPDAAVRVRCALAPPSTDGGLGELRISIENAAGPNHAKLRAFGTDDLLLAGALDARLSNHIGCGCGQRESTFVGLSDMLFAADMLNPPAQLRLLVLPDHVRFELECRLAVTTPMAEPHSPTKLTSLTARQDSERDPTPSPTSAPYACSMPELPAGLVFVMVDDDEIARIWAENLITACRGDVERSQILGASYEEALDVPQRLHALSEELGSQQRIVGIFDQNMNYDEGDVLGTDLCSRLRRDYAWEGVLFIQSANDSESDAAAYRRAGADGSFGKEIGSMKRAMTQLGCAISTRARSGSAQRAV